MCHGELSPRACRGANHRLLHSFLGKLGMTTYPLGMTQATKLTLGLLTHNDQKYLDRCLETLTAQEGLGQLGQDWLIVIRDNGSDDEAYLKEAEQKYPRIQILYTGDNAGFARGHNDIMRRFPAQYHGVLNNDVLYEPDFFKNIIDALDANVQYGSATGKLLQWDYGNDPEKTNVIDTVGIGITQSHRFYDIGQGEEDVGQYDEVCSQFGSSGSAVVYRRNDLMKVMYMNGEFYDETMFMYKEDCDLAERLVAIGKPCLYTPDSRAWHDRTASSTISRTERSTRERAGSAAHQSIIIQKHWKWLPLGVKVRTALREIFRWGYLLVTEPSVYKAARSLMKERSDEIKKRRAQTRHTVSFKSIRIYFSH
jgi:GT2 family glycosyltransferase